MKPALALAIAAAALPSSAFAQPTPGAEAPLRPVSTYSIVARDPATGELGVAVQSHWFGVGAIVAFAEAGVGAVATQSFVDPSYGPLGLELMRAGRTAPEALAGLLEADPHPDVRQVAMIDAGGNVAAHTGENAIIAAGHHTGENYSVQANLMASETVWPAMARAFESTEGDLGGTDDGGARGRAGRRRRHPRPAVGGSPGRERNPQRPAVGRPGVRPQDRRPSRAARGAPPHPPSRPRVPGDERRRRGDDGERGGRRRRALRRRRHDGAGKRRDGVLGRHHARGRRPSGRRPVAARARLRRRPRLGGAHPAAAGRRAPARRPRAAGATPGDPREASREWRSGAGSRPRGRRLRLRSSPAERGRRREDLGVTRVARGALRPATSAPHERRRASRPRVRHGDDLRLGERGGHRRDGPARIALQAARVRVPVLGDLRRRWARPGITGLSASR